MRVHPYSPVNGELIASSWGRLMNTREMPCYLKISCSFFSQDGLLQKLCGLLLTEVAPGQTQLWRTPESKLKKVCSNRSMEFSEFFLRILAQGRCKNSFILMWSFLSSLRSDAFSCLVLFLMLWLSDVFSHLWHKGVHNAKLNNKTFICCPGRPSSSDYY